MSRARRDGGLSTHLTSIDPAPRAEIDALCDEVIRAPLEGADLGILGRLQPGDMLFFDGSHRVFMNADTVAFFLDVLPALPPGVIVGVHDIRLPDDYPPEFAERWYSEQYLLACWLLAESPRVKPLLAARLRQPPHVAGEPARPAVEHAGLRGGRAPRRRVLVHDRADVARARAA